MAEVDTSAAVPAPIVERTTYAAGGAVFEYSVATEGALKCPIHTTGDYWDKRYLAKSCNFDWCGGGPVRPLRLFILAIYLLRATPYRCADVYAEPSCRFYNYGALRPLLMKYLLAWKHLPCLHVGCGNSNIQEGLMDDGFVEVINVGACCNYSMRAAWQQFALRINNVACERIM